MTRFRTFAPSTSTTPCSTTYREQLPLVVASAHAFWLGVGRRVPLAWLLEIGSRQLRAASEAGEPLVLDFATPLLAELAGSTDVTAEAA
ncbi:MAG: hypothetical protein FJ096_00955 [Deltaproteobacteria bacterium]|nr:hypothetical protein [Deltaproteobacteria bacterium]